MRHSVWRRTSKSYRQRKLEDCDLPLPNIRKRTMKTRTASELRLVAAEFRELASQGDDFRLQEALRLVAEDFEREADRVDALGAADTSPTGLL